MIDIEKSFARANKDLVEAFERYMTARGLSVRTKRAYLDSVGRLVQLLGSQSVLEAGRTEVRELQAAMLEKGLSENSLRLHTEGIRAFFKFLHVDGLIVRDPMLLVAQRKVPERLPRVLTVEEIEKLIGAAQNPKEFALIEVMYATALRVSELIALRLEDVDMEARTIRVRKGKGDKERIVLFGQKAHDALLDYVGDQRAGYVFWHNEGEPFSQNGIRYLVRQIAKRAGVPGVHPHSLRRACATHMLADGADLRCVQELLGHESLSTTAIYTHLTDADLQRVYRCHPHAGNGQ
jgi:site-specific recombinase XerD